VNISKDELVDLYWKKKLSLREIADVYNVSYSHIYNLMRRYKIPRRPSPQRIREQSANYKPVKFDKIILKGFTDKLIELERSLPKVDYSRKKQLYYVPFSKDKELTVTIVISDLHIGDSNFLHETWKSTVDNLLEFLRDLKDKYIIAKCFIVFNGDLVSGREVYKLQELQNILQRGHWQVFTAEKILKGFIAKLSEIVSVERCYFVKGTHEDISTNLMLFLKRMFKEAKYLSRGGIVDIGNKRPFYIFVSHGFGSSDYYPVSLTCIRDVTRQLLDYKTRGIDVKRVITSHSHWLSPEFILNVPWSITGGFQKWEKKFFQRPSGLIVLLCNDRDSVAIPIMPNKDVERKEKTDPMLEYRNFLLYGKILISHAKKIEKIKLGEMNVNNVKQRNS